MTAKAFTSGTLTVIVPAFNAAETLIACLKAIQASSRKPDEIIVFDDGSTDDTAAIAEAYGAMVIGHKGKNIGPGEGRNRASLRTKSDILVFIDADVEVHPDAIAILEAEITASPDIAAAFGAYDDAPRCANIAARYANLRHHFVHSHAPSEATTFWSGLGAVRHEAFDAVGGFDSRYAKPSIEDVELGTRLKRHGYRVRLTAQARGKHWKNWTLKQLWHTDVFKRALPWSQLIIAGKASGGNLNAAAHERVSAVLAHGLWLACVLSLFWPSAWIVAAAIAGAYAANNRRFLGLLARKGGLGLLLSGLFLHLCYHLYASVTYAWVLVSERPRRTKEVRVPA
jgi:glycosyltransferase involved in cell wall biosynthesis